MSAVGSVRPTDGGTARAGCGIKIVGLFLSAVSLSACFLIITAAVALQFVGA